MKVIDVKHVEDCFDGSLIKELLLDTEISKKLIFALGEGGDVQYFSHFARPFFKIRVEGLYDLKGIEGNRTMRIHLKSVERFTMEDMRKKIEGFRAEPTERAVPSVESFPMCSNMEASIQCGLAMPSTAGL